jgi:hypothetical protein
MLSEFHGAGYLADRSKSGQLPLARYRRPRRLQGSTRAAPASGQGSTRAAPTSGQGGTRAERARG